MFAHVKGTVSAAPNNRFRLAIYTDVSGGPGNSTAVSATLSANTAARYSLYAQ